MIAIRFEYKGKLRAGILRSNEISRKGHAYFRVYHGNGQCKSYRYERASRIVLFNMTGLTVQVSPL